MCTQHPPKFLAEADSAADRRRSGRQACHWRSGRALIAAFPIDPWLAPLRNISVGGLQLELSVRFDPGTDLLLHVFNPSRRFRCQLAARIVYCKRLDGDFVAGVAFHRPLNAAEQEGLLDSEAPLVVGQ